MKKQSKKQLYMALAFLAIFLLWTFLLRMVDVEPIGPEGTKVGFAALNGAVHDLTGVHWMLYIVTDWMGLIPVGICFGFAILGLRQLIVRKSLFRVDRDILALGGFYILVFAAYLLFEEVALNYRPVLVEGRLEASYPSSTTILALCVLPTAQWQLRRRIRSVSLRKAVEVLLIGLTAFLVVGRLLSGVHWFTDIVGAVLLSAGLDALYMWAATDRSF